MINFNNIKYSNNLLLFHEILKSKNAYFFSSKHFYSNLLYKNINKNNNNIIISHSSFLHKNISHINFIQNYNYSPLNNNNIINILIADKHKQTIQNYDLSLYSTKQFNNNYKQSLINNNIITNSHFLINIIYFNIYLSINKLYIFDYESLLIYDNYDEYIYNYNLVNHFIKWCCNNNYISIVLVDTDTLYRINLNSDQQHNSRDIIINDKKLNMLIKNKKILAFLNKLIFNFKLNLLSKFIINIKKPIQSKPKIIQSKLRIVQSKSKIIKNKNINTKTLNHKNIKKKKNNNYDNDYLNSINY